MRKAITAALAALCLGATLAFSLPQTALAAGGGKHAGAKRLQKMAAALSLTGKQEVAIKPILMGMREQVKAVKQDTTLSPADRKARMKAIRASMESRILPLLTADQKTKLVTILHHAKRAKAA